MLPVNAATPPQKGVFDDGAILVWQCQKGMLGKVGIGLVTPDGHKYEAVVDCLPPPVNPKDI